MCVCAGESKSTVKCLSVRERLELGQSATSIYYALRLAAQWMKWMNATREHASSVFCTQEQFRSFKENLSTNLPPSPTRYNLIYSWLLNFFANIFFNLFVCFFFMNCSKSYIPNFVHILKSLCTLGWPNLHTKVNKNRLLVSWNTFLYVHFPISWFRNIFC